MDIEADNLYSCSKWNKRMSPEEVIIQHGEVFAKCKLNLIITLNISSLIEFELF